MSHRSSQWSHVDNNVHKGNELITQTTTVADGRDNKLLNKQIKQLQDASEPPAKQALKENSPEPSTSSSPKKRKKHSPPEVDMSDHPWKEGFSKLFRKFLNKPDVSKILHILEKLEATEHFVLNDNGTMYYKGQLIGNAILCFYYLFKTERNRKTVAKHVNNLRKLLGRHNINLYK
jgi:hypothetical protein